MSTGRLKREAEFHDKAFAAGLRESINFTYSVTGSSKQFYREFVASHSTGRRVLEYGCGPFSYSSLMFPNGARVAAIDLSLVAMRQYQERVRSQHLGEPQPCVMNAELLAFGDRSFDMVCGIAILHHLDFERSLREVNRVLRHGGLAVFLEPLGHNPVLNLARRLTAGMRTVDEHPLLTTDLRVAERHFASVEQHYFHLLSLLAIPFCKTRWFPRIIQSLEAWDQKLFRTFPYFKRHAWAVALVLSSPTTRSEAG